MTDTFDCREPFANAILNAAEKDKRIVVICNDSVGSSNMVTFQARYPDRLINVGIAEQNMIGVAAGLANAGMIPVVCAASCFLCARAYEQIKVDIGYSKANVKMFGVSPGFAYGALGATHHSPEDVALMLSIPGISVAVPSDPAETEAATIAALQTDGPTFVRVLRTPVSPIEWLDGSYNFGASQSAKNGTDVLFVANGLATHQVIDAAKRLSAEGVHSTIVNASSVRPLDGARILRAAKDCSVVITVEEGNILGGLGSAVSCLLGELGERPPVMQCGVDEFAPTGSTQDILSHFALDPAGLTRATLDFVDRAGLRFARPAAAIASNE